jgi:ABC-type polar amino acid transport system ATPase subunit
VSSRTVLENIMMGPLKVQRWPREKIEPMARDLLRKIGLLDKAGQYAARLSGGQQ